MGYFGFVQRSTLTFYHFCIYIYNTSTHSVSINFNMAKIRISHLSDPLCMQLHLSYTPRISYLHTNVSCSPFHSMLMAKSSTHWTAVKYGRNITRIQVPKRRGKMSVITNTVFSFRKNFRGCFTYLPKKQFSITHSSTIPIVWIVKEIQVYHWQRETT